MYSLEYHSLDLNKSHFQGLIALGDYSVGKSKIFNLLTIRELEKLRELNKKFNQIIRDTNFTCKQACKLMKMLHKYEYNFNYDQLGYLSKKVKKITNPWHNQNLDNMRDYAKFALDESEVIDEEYIFPRNNDIAIFMRNSTKIKQDLDFIQKCLFLEELRLNLFSPIINLIIEDKMFYNNKNVKILNIEIKTRSDNLYVFMFNKFQCNKSIEFDYIEHDILSIIELIDRFKNLESLELFIEGYKIKNEEVVLISEFKQKIQKKDSEESLAIRMKKALKLTYDEQPSTDEQSPSKKIRLSDPSKRANNNNLKFNL